MEKIICAFQEIKREVRQGCVLSIDLINMYIETILRALEDMARLKICGKTIDNLRNADDTVVTSFKQGR